jgi:hypothetical protein
MRQGESEKAREAFAYTVATGNETIEAKKAKEYLDSFSSSSEI